MPTCLKGIVLPTTGETFSKDELEAYKAMKYKEISSFVVCMFLLNLFAATLNNYYILKTSFSETLILNI